MKTPKYDDLTVAELRKLAKKHGLKISSKAKKSEIILALQAHLSPAKTTQKTNHAKQATTIAKSSTKSKQASKLTSNTSSKTKPKTTKAKSKTSTTKSKAKPKASLADTQKPPLKQASKTAKKAISKKSASQTKAVSTTEPASKPTLSTKPQATATKPQSKPKTPFEVAKPKVASVFPFAKPVSSSKIPPKPLADALHTFSKQNIVAMTVSSKKIYTYWEVSPEVTHLDSHRLNIKVINKKTGEFFYLPITKPKDETFVDVKPGAKYELQIGKVSKNGKFKLIEKSQVVSVPTLKHTPTKTITPTATTTTTTQKAQTPAKPKQVQTEGKTSHLTVKPIGRLPQKFFEFDLTEGSY